MSSSSCSIDNAVLDLADLFRWSPVLGHAVSPSAMQRMMRTLPFSDYEKGSIDEKELYALLESHFPVQASDIADSFHAARAALYVQADILEVLRRTKAATNIRVYGRFKVSAPDWDFIRNTIRTDVWSTFDNVLTSAEMGARMPELGLYLRFLELNNLNPRRTAFVSSRLEHAISATSLGMVNIPFTSCEALAQTLRILTRDAVADGDSFLREHARTMWSTTDTGVELKENFAQLLMLEVTGDRSLVDLPKPECRMRFFKGMGVLTTEKFPPDVDTTSLAFTAMYNNYSDDQKSCAMDEILTLRNADGIILTYFDLTRPRIDPVVCVNALTFFHTNGRGAELPETFDWVYHVLRTRAYASGTLYYYGADTFLYFLSRLLAVPGTLPFHSDLAEVFKDRIEEQFGEPGDALALSMRVLAAASVNLSDRRGYDRLLALQEADGAWPTGWVYKYGMSGVLVGNRGLTTAMAVAAIRHFRALQDVGL
ncbi:uncharacterized protein TRAVEDRAFT_43985 [Trametes versicolor FP-101664 SS1]|uniref:uncharacterized protein n=1 Tax=Trametes versicolor (strain FP-101664) TaxID=717944 RepID=UPI00046231CC|nr:uncharacterized protein TRAVEDRAFT_43985 [Trametes versicolor FP-101664 SS1]EIW61160.1 hypothetical protein TRAVEDRAFT_43985 [Trametes versicolor FP-101664 SS1]